MYKVIFIKEDDGKVLIKKEDLEDLIESAYEDGYLEGTRDNSQNGEVYISWDDDSPWTTTQKTVITTNTSTNK